MSGYIVVDVLSYRCFPISRVHSVSWQAYWMIAPAVTQHSSNTIHILEIKFIMSFWNPGAVLVPKLWMMTTYGAHEVAFLKLAPSSLMDPHEAQGSKDISFEGSNSHDDPAQGSNNVSTPIHGTVQLHTLVFGPLFNFQKL